MNEELLSMIDATYDASKGAIAKLGFTFWTHAEVNGCHDNLYRRAFFLRRSSISVSSAYGCIAVADRTGVGHHALGGFRSRVSRHVLAVVPIRGRTSP